jgi:hypothetical protein
MRVSGIAREYSTLLFPALDIALNYSLSSLVIALHRLSSIFTACHRWLPLAIAGYRLPSLVIALYRLPSFFTALSLVIVMVIAFHRSSPLVIFLYRLISLFPSSAAL